MKTYFYMIERDGQIYEIEDIGTRFKDCLELWQKGGLIIFPSLGINVNGVDVKKILDMDQYDNFIDSSQPKQFIKNGTWFDIKERSKPIRHEKWRQQELDSKRRLQISGPENEVSKEQMREWLDKYTPECVKLARKMRIK